MRLAPRLVLLTVLSAPLLAAGLANHTYWLADEPFVAEVGREMAASGDWVVPRLNGRPFLEKPPLHAAAVAVSFRTLGVTPLASRLPSALATLLTILALYLLGRRLLDERSALWAALLYPTVSQVFYVAHYCLVDAFLALFVTTGFLAGAYAFGPDRRRWAAPALYASGALAFLSKGIVGPGLLGAGLLAFALLRRDRRFPSFREHVAGAALATLLVTPWIAGLWAAGGRAYMREAFVVNTVGRFVARSGLVPADDRPGQHVEPPWFYLEDLPANFLPWTPLLVLAGAAAAEEAWKRRRSGGTSPEGESFLWSAFLPGFLILSGASEKRGVYLLPLYPVLTLLAAHHVRRAACAPAVKRWERIVLGSQTGLTLLFGLAVAAAVVYASGPESGRPPGAAAVLAGTAIAAGAAAAGILGARAILRDRIGPLARVLWLQTAVALLALALCAPLLEPLRSLAPFFETAARLESERGRTPVLFTAHESLIGYAGLYFGTVLPRLEYRPGSGRPWPGGDTADVVTDIGGLRALTDDPSVRVAVLLRGGAAFSNSTGIPYLLACTWSPPPGRTARAP